MEVASKMQKIITIVGISILVLVVIIMGIFIFNRDSKSKQGSINVDYGFFDKLLYITNALPIGDEMGKSLEAKDIQENVEEYLEFSLKEEKGKNAKFEIYLKKLDVSKEIDSNYIKLYLTDMNNKAVSGFESNIIPTFNSLNVSKESGTDKVLYQGKIKALEEQKYKLRVWLADASAIEKEKKEFKMELGVRVY